MTLSEISPPGPSGSAVRRRPHVREGDGLFEISPPGPNDTAVLTRPQVREGDGIVRDIAIKDRRQ